MPSFRFIISCAVVTGLTGVLTQSIAAQELEIGGSNSNYGTVTLSPGFTPDPHQVSVTSGGKLSVRDMGLGSGCVGYATSRPDFIVHVSSSMDFLRFYGEGEGDTGLIINDPSGTWHCDDDTHSGTNPMVSIANARGGQYDVWVSSYSNDENIRSTLFVTELRSNPSSGGSSSSAERLRIGGNNANFGTVNLNSGFTPDPHVVSITSGGDLDVRAMSLGSGCVGYATGQPDLILNVSGDVDFLRFYNEGDGDTGLIINTPSGDWLCDDDSHTGTNPMVTFENAASGHYDVWVSSYSSEENIRGSLHITELRSYPQNGGGKSSGGRLLPGGSNANYGAVTLSPGFTPDPHDVSMTSGGSLSVNEMGLGSGCVGYATELPDFQVRLTGSSTRLRFYVTGNGDTGLVVNGPSGGWHCNDDSYGGVNPTVTIGGAQEGLYDIWVTSYSADDRLSSVLHITELESNHPDR